NNFIFKGMEEDPQISVGRAEDVVESYKRIQVPKNQSTSKHQSSNQQVWLPPPDGWYKMNVDVAMKDQNQIVGLEVVVRDFKGKVVAIVVQRIIYNGNVDHMAVEAVNYGI
ncbi:hypothetical protein CICLE_v10018170mg, partial [Citrus x clementina]